MITEKQIQETVQEIETALKKISGKRLQVRNIDVGSAVDLVVERAHGRRNVSGQAQYVIECFHGGSVANSYNYFALTEGMVLVANWPAGLLKFAVCRLPANKVTDAGVLKSTIGEEARAYRDYRFGEIKTLAARDAIIRHFHSSVVLNNDVGR